MNFELWSAIFIFYLSTFHENLQKPYKKPVTELNLIMPHLKTLQIY